MCVCGSVLCCVSGPCCALRRHWWLPCSTTKIVIVGVGLFAGDAQIAGMHFLADNASSDVEAASPSASLCLPLSLGICSIAYALCTRGRGKLCTHGSLMTAAGLTGCVVLVCCL